MRAFGRLSSLAALLALAVAGAATSAPARVVSTNLCTDQLALMLAAPGQLVSVSFLSQDPVSSPMAEAARALPANRGRAEEVFLMAPDLVIGGTFTASASLAMLERLGVRVEVLPPATSFGEVRENVRLMGALLGREDAAEAMIGEFDAGLRALASGKGRRPRAALYQAQGYMSGAGTLAGEILGAAGFANVAEEAGLPSGGFVPLESLVMLSPDLVVAGRRQQGASRAEAILDHPALAAAVPRTARTGPDWTCGTPLVLDAVGRLARERRALQGGE